MIHADALPADNDGEVPLNRDEFLRGLGIPLGVVDLSETDDNLPEECRTKIRAFLKDELPPQAASIVRKLCAGPWKKAWCEEILRQATSKDLRVAIGLSAERQYFDEEMAPPVDRDLLQAYENKSLSPDQNKMVTELIVSFRSWDDAYRSISLANLKRDNIKDQK